MRNRPVTVAIVGAGPSGLYVADMLAAQEETPFQVDVLDKLPTPFGLVRYGVAPDHLHIRSVRRTLEAVFSHPRVRFLGNVELGQDTDLAELHQFYDAIVLTLGASISRGLEIPGEELLGSLSAPEVVAWYCGHPDVVAGAIEESLRVAKSAVVIGNGNVAVDVARILLKGPNELEFTDMPQHVLDALLSSSIKEVHLLGRRGPAYASFTTKELRELGDLSEATVHVDPEDMIMDAMSGELAASDRRVARNIETLSAWTGEDAFIKPRHLGIQFWTRPIEILGTDRVEGIVVEKTRYDDMGTLISTGVTSVIPADLVIRSVGYQSDTLQGVAFDRRLRTVRNDVGRILSETGEVVEGEFAAGWLKRGPTGIIGTNKIDAKETVETILADLARLPIAPNTPDAFELALKSRGVSVVHYEGWKEIDKAEISLGQSHGRDRTTIHERDALMMLGSHVDDVQ